MRWLSWPGKPSGVPLATSAHYTLATIVLEGTGKSLQELGVKLVNMTPSEGIKMPAGLDAAAVWVPVRFMDQSLGTATLLMDSSGYTGPGHKLKGKRAPERGKGLGLPGGIPAGPAIPLRKTILCERASRSAGGISASAH